VAGERDACLDRGHASRSELAVALSEGGAVVGKSPGDAHERVAMLGQALAADAPAAGDGRGLVGRRRKSGGRIEVFGRRPAFDRQAERAELRGANSRDARQGGQDLAGSLGEQRGQLAIGPGRCRLAGSASGADRGRAERRAVRRPAAARAAASNARPRTRRSPRSSGPAPARAVTWWSVAGRRTLPRRPGPLARSASTASAPARGRPEPTDPDRAR
jgi:hypothetical protein